MNFGYDFGGTFRFRPCRLFGNLVRDRVSDSHRWSFLIQLERLILRDGKFSLNRASVTAAAAPRVIRRDSLVALHLARRRSHFSVPKGVSISMSCSLVNPKSRENHRLKNVSSDHKLVVPSAIAGMQVL